MRTAIFPGSFDPFTSGHKEIVQSALQLFDKVIIAIGNNSSKKGFLTHESRIKVIEDSIVDLKATGSDIEVISYSGLTTDLCQRLGAKFIVRGVRSGTDFESEYVIAQANKKLLPEVSTIFLTTSLEHSIISSTIVRDIVLNGGDAKEFLAPGVDLNKYR